MNFLFYASLTFLIVGCGSNSTNQNMDMAEPTLGPAPPLAMPCMDAPADVYNLPTLSAFDASKRGEVFHCAPGESLTAAKVNAELTGYMNIGGGAVSGFWTYRVAFRSQRGK